jgi:hypothetical protein
MTRPAQHKTFRIVGRNLATWQLTFRRRQKEQAFAARRGLRGLASAMESIVMEDGRRRMKDEGSENPWNS